MTVLKVELYIATEIERCVLIAMTESLNCGCEIHGKDSIIFKVNVHHWWN